jgi:NAD(P)-dependent dehydrogenase (short-subunit alcohol dehydrogenase family)
MARLAGMRAIITGAGSGIGRASAELFAKEGASLVLSDVSEQVEAVAAEILAAGGKAIARIADAGDEADVEALVKTCVREYGGVDIAFANAGIIESMNNRLFDLTVEDWQKVLQVNLIGPFLLTKYAGEQMVEQGSGAILMTASVAGLRANAGASAYSASKAGVINLTQTAANTLAGTGVRVNAICPGLIHTGMTEVMFERAKQKGTPPPFSKLNPLRREGSAQEIAAMALFLASDEASYVNGQAIAVDGGLSSTHPFAG